ncbi:MAG: MCE family protein [Bacteroidales bacterium]|nr:MCE family protein [Bacteroidales bacterium]
MILNVNKDVNGLTVSSPVHFRGLKIGIVENIEFDQQKDYFKVALNVSSEYDIPQDSRVEVYSSDLLGGKALKLIYGTSQEILDESDTISGGVAEDMISSITSKIEPLAAEAYTLMQNVNKTLDNVNATLDSNARVNIQSALANLDKTLANASQLSRKLNDMAPEVNDIVKNLNVLSKGLSEGTNDIKGTLANVNSITSQLSKAELTETLNNLKSLLNKLQDPNGSVGKLLTTDSLHNSVNTLVQDVDILVKRITENPKKYIKVSVF